MLGDADAIEILDCLNFLIDKTKQILKCLLFRFSFIVILIENTYRMNVKAIYFTDNLQKIVTKLIILI